MRAWLPSWWTTGWLCFTSPAMVNRSRVPRRLHLAPWIACWQRRRPLSRFSCWPGGWPSIADCNPEPTLAPGRSPRMSELRVALTFDAEHPSRRQCPPGAAEAIINTLAELRVKATFFVQGRWATAYPDVARSIARDRHLVGNHSHSHAPMPALSDQGLGADVDEAEASIREVMAVDPRPWFRCPFGEGADDPRVVAALRQRGYRNVHWDVAVSDWEDDRTADGIEKDVVDATLSHGD